MKLSGGLDQLQTKWRDLKSFKHSKLNGLNPAMNTEVVLEVKNVTKSFGYNQVIRDASLQVRKGEMVGIVGENGAGKSTLLRIIVGLLSPNKGRVVVRGKTGYCPQEQLSFETLTVFENLYYFAVGYGLTNAGDTGSWEQVKDELLERFRFKQWEHTLVYQLSGGTKQKLNLSLALLHSPNLLILDEPYSGFDWETYLQFWEFTGTLRNQGKSILTVSHLVYDQSKFDRIFELHDGILTCV